MVERAKRLPRLLLAALVLLAATSAGGFFGFGTAGLYIEGPEHAWLHRLGMALGLVGGFTTACLWLIAMFHKMSKPQHPWIVVRGAALGMVAGVLTATFLHAVLIGVTHQTWMIKVMAPVFILIGGAPVGFLVGLAGGLAARVVVKREQPRGEHVKRLPQVVLSLFVILAATTVSRYFGMLAGAICGEIWEKPSLEAVGTDAGTVAGLLAAIVWLLAMTTIKPKADPGHVILAGSCLGTGAGLLASLILHAALLISGSGYSIVEHLAIAAIFGLPAGFITGLISGLAAWATAKWSRRHE